MVRQRIFLALSKSAYLLAHWQNGPWKADKIWPYFRSTSRKSPNLSLPSAKIGEWSLCTSFGLYEQTFYAFYSTIGMFKWICLLILLDIILIKPFFQHSIFIKIKQIKNLSFFMVIRIWFKHFIILLNSTFSFMMRKALKSGRKPFDRKQIGMSKKSMFWICNQQT